MVDRLGFTDRPPRRIPGRVTGIAVRLDRRSRKYRPWLTAARTRSLRRLYGEAQSERRQDHREAIEARIAPLGQGPIQRLAGDPRSCRPVRPILNSQTSPPTFFQSLSSPVLSRSSRAVMRAPVAPSRKLASYSVSGTLPSVVWYSRTSTFFHL